MIQVKFRNMGHSKIVESVARDRFLDFIEKFPELHHHDIVLTLAMDNSPHQKGPDHFSAKLRIHGRRYSNIILKKSDDNLYSALALVDEALWERLNRTRTRRRDQYRQSKRELDFAYAS